MVSLDGCSMLHERKYMIYYFIYRFFLENEYIARDIGQCVEEFFLFFLFAEEFYYSLKYGLADDQYEL